MASEPRRDPRRGLGALRDLLGELPAQPDGRGRLPLVLRAARGARPRARLLPRGGRGVHRDLVRPASIVGARARRSEERRRLPDAVEAIVDDGLPQRVRVRATRADRGAAQFPAERRHGAAGVRAACVAFYLWFRVPDGETSEAFATRLLEHGLVVAPGSYFGPSGEGYARLALVPDVEACARAAAILREVL